MSQEQTRISAPVATAIDAMLATCGTSLQELTTQKQELTAGQLLNIKDVAKRLKVSIPTVYRMIQRGTIKPIKINENCTRIPELQIIEIAKGV